VLSKPPMKRIPADTPDATLAVPGSLMGLLATFAPLFITPSSRHPKKIHVIRLAWEDIAA
jgi:hypothetical protein